MIRFEKLISGKYFPIFLLFIIVVTWGFLIPDYGFYLDDWISVAGYDQGGFLALQAYALQDSRVGLQPWVHGLGFKLVGTNVLGWQIYSLFWRWLAGVMNWLLLRKIWKKQSVIAIFSSILLMIFPFFKHQAFSIAYVQVWMQSALILLSFYLMTAALQAANGWRKTALTISACLVSGIQLFMTEYFLTIELIRVVIIWVVLRQAQQSQTVSGKARLKTVLKNWLPYFLIWAAYLLWRFAVLPQLMHDRNELELLTEHETLSGLALYLVQLFIQYLSESIWGVWYRSIDPANLDFALPSFQAALLAGILISLLLFIGMHWLWRKDRFPDDASHSDLERKEILLVGIGAMLLGYLPGMMIDKSPSTSFVYHDRFLLPSFWGIALTLTAAIWLLMRGPALKLMILSALCGISVFFQIKNSVYYRTAWENQQKFQWQLKWRVPDLKENTAILGDAIIASFMGSWADGSMVFEMYGKKTGFTPTPYWYFVVGEGDFKQELEQQLPLSIKTKIFDFSAQPGDYLVITKSEWDRCLWVLDEADLYNPYIQPVTKNLIQYQNKSRILYESDHQLPASVFGKDYPHDWCYFYENAAREVDLENYSSALSLYQNAVSQEFVMKNPVEMTPFIRAAAMSGDWALAEELTETASIEPHITWEYFAKLWEALLRETEESEERMNAHERVQEWISPNE